MIVCAHRGSSIYVRACHKAAPLCNVCVCAPLTRESASHISGRTAGICTTHLPTSSCCRETLCPWSAEAVDGTSNMHAVTTLLSRLRTLCGRVCLCDHVVDRRSDLSLSVWRSAGTSQDVRYPAPPLQQENARHQHDGHIATSWMRVTLSKSTDALCVKRLGFNNRDHL